MVGLALESGGFNGAYEIGAYLALRKNHIKIDIVVGTSIGSLNAALIASNDDKKIKTLWTDPSINQLMYIDDSVTDSLFRDGFPIPEIWTMNEIYKLYNYKNVDITWYSAIVRNNIDEEKMRKSKTRFGLTTMRLDNFEPTSLYLDNIPVGKLHDYIVLGSYFPVFTNIKRNDNHSYNSRLFNMLEKSYCSTIYIVNTNISSSKKIKSRNDADVIIISPSDNVGNVLMFDKNTPTDNLFRGYLDTFKALDKLDGIDYYFKKKSDRYYNKLNKNMNKELLEMTIAMLDAKNIKDLIIKALEYVLKRERCTSLRIYDPSEVIDLVKKTDNPDNIIYRYVSNLNI